MKPAGITLCLVADGMGGAQAGEVASRIASETVQRDVQAALLQGMPAEDEDWHALLRRCVVAANKQVYDQARSSSAQRGMGTTLTTLVVVGARAHLAHVGDSRAYLISAGGATTEGQDWLQLSNDHSLVARLLDIGQLTPEEARVHPQRNMLYRSLGTDPQVEVDVGSYSIQAGDLLLLCSDGLTNYIEDAELARMALAAPSLQVACDRLVALANQRGGRDNISVVLAKVGS